MTRKSARKVVIINDIKSDVIEQAIFILKSEDKKEKTEMAVMRNDRYIVCEAQKIIDNYVYQIERTRDRTKKINSVNRRKQKKVIGVLVTVIGLAGAGIFACQLINLILR